MSRTLKQEGNKSADLLNSQIVQSLQISLDQKINGLVNNMLVLLKKLLKNAWPIGPIKTNYLVRDISTCHQFNN
jgi:hypothetical protein